MVSRPDDEVATDLPEEEKRKARNEGKTPAPPSRVRGLPRRAAPSGSTGLRGAVGMPAQAKRGLRRARHLHVGALLAAELLVAALDGDVLAAAAPVIALHLARRHCAGSRSKDPATEGDSGFEIQGKKSAPARPVPGRSEAEFRLSALVGILGSVASARRPLRRVPLAASRSFV